MWNPRPRLLGLSLVGLALLVTGTASAQICGSITTVPLVAGQQFSAGHVQISNDETFLYVIYSTAGTDALITETHLAIGSSLGDIPLNPKGCPKNGQFDQSSTHRPGVTQVVDVLRLADYGLVPGQPLVVAAHAVVTSPTFGGQTAWGAGSSFECSNWATYTRTFVKSCGPEFE
jgi:hypothetical protein